METCGIDAHQLVLQEVNGYDGRGSSQSHSQAPVVRELKVIEMEGIRKAEVRWNGDSPLNRAHADTYGEMIIPFRFSAVGFYLALKPKRE